MTKTPEQGLLEVLLDSWDRNNTIMVSLLRTLPEGGLKARAIEGSPSVAQLFAHVCFVRLASVSESDSELTSKHPEIVPRDDEEWLDEHDLVRIAQMLNKSAKVVREAVKGWVKAGLSIRDRGTNAGYDHPILLLQHMLWHEGYHVGQIKLALKLTGHALTDQQAGPVTWGIWSRHLM